MKLTASQKKAIEHDGRNLQLIACAGSGKTEVVARRVVHLLTPGRSDTLLPRNIVAFTFTEKAAAELKERIVTRTREELGDIPGMAEMFVGTIHAFCLELLKTESPKYLKYEVLNEVQQRLLIDRNSSRSGLTTSTDLRGQPLRRYIDTQRYIEAISILREADLDVEQLAGCSLLAGYRSYDDLLDSKSYLDYSSILENALQAITDDAALRDRLAERIRYVIVDEYQDVNPIQERIVSWLHDLGARLCVVGDDDQTIYQWRGSDVQNILTFADRYPEVEKVPIEENFRSSDGVVLTAQPFIAQNASRLPKAMKPTGAQPYEPGDVVALSFDTPEQEAAHIVAMARELRGVAFSDNGDERGLAWSDMAVLLRSVKANAAPITDALEEAGIPYIVTGMTNLFGTEEAEAARQLFYYIADHTPRGGQKPTAATLRQSWIDAELGVAMTDLDAAIAEATVSKRNLTDPEQKRWGEYSIQRVFLQFLDTAGVREERVPNGAGDVIFYNLGKFSQVISDFEAINFHSKPVEKYTSFASFLEFQAEDAYPEGWQDNQYASPDAIRVMTVHQAKGMQWPVVFLPALLRNRFPAAGVAGKTVWHLLPAEGVEGQARFVGSTEDERRLFYVAMTRAQKFLHMTWAPIAGRNNRYTRASEFWDDILASPYVKRRPPSYASRKRLPPQTRAAVANVIFTFSDLKYFFECPYQFKLRVLYGFNPPIHEALGYGKSLHDALADVHARALRGDIAPDSEAPSLVATHLHVPYAYPRLREQLEAAATKILADYLTKHGPSLNKLEYSEKQIEINLGEGVSVTGRIDLVKRLDTNEISIVDLKSSERVQSEEVTETQLHVYALGYQELTGARPDYVEIHELDGDKQKRRSVDDDFIADVKDKTRRAAVALRKNDLPTVATAVKCTACDYRGMCTAGRAAVGGP